MIRVLISLTVVAILAGIGYVFFHQGSLGAEAIPPLVFNDEVEPPPRIVPEGYVEYRNRDLGFSFFRPTETPVQEYVTADTLTLLFQRRPGETGFQIYATKYDGTEVTPERFLEDNPSGVRESEEPTVVGGAPATSFYSSNLSLGETFEVWFIKDGYLFEVTTYKELNVWLKDMLATWEFI